MLQRLSFLVVIFSLQNVFSQPLASPKAMGMDIRYFLSYGMGIKSAQVNFDQGDRVEIPQGQEEILGEGVFHLAGMESFWGWSFGVGAEIENRHEIAFRYNQSLYPYVGNDAARVVDLVQLGVDYKFLFLKKSWVKPYVGVGFDYLTLEYPYSFTETESGKTYDAKLVGKGGHLNLGVALYYSRFGLLLGPSYEFFGMDHAAVEDDGFDLSPSLDHQVFGFEIALRFYF